MDRRTWIAVAAVIVSVALAIAGVGFALAARDLKDAAVAVGGWTNPPTVIRPSHSVLLGRTRSLARLETASATLEQRVVGQRGSDGSWSWIGERIVFVARGEVSAGVDLAGLDEEDLVVAPDGTVVLTLPDVDILHVTVDEEASFIAARERGWFGIPDADLETGARREAVRALEAAARRGQLLDDARLGAEDALRALLLDAGATAVDIR